jgi:ribosomal protein S18 acetylase RimI-like enzyme
MNLIYKFVSPEPSDALNLYKKSGIYSELWNLGRMASVLENSNLIVCCYDNEKLIGIARGITDFHWIAHLSHLAVHPDYRGKSIGKSLIKQMKSKIGDNVSLMVHSSNEAKNFYQKIGFEAYSDMYIIRRKR